MKCNDQMPTAQECPRDDLGEKCFLSGPCPIILVPQEMYFGSLKGVFFIQNANNLNFILFFFFRLFIYIILYIVQYILYFQSLIDFLVLDFDVRKKLYKLPEEGGGSRQFGQCPKEHLFSPGTLPYKAIQAPLAVKVAKKPYSKRHILITLGAPPAEAI